MGGGGGKGGGGGGGGSARTPVEQPDTLKSRQRAQIVDLICEGPILGPVDGLESVYLNDTPVLNADASANFSGVDIAWRAGHQVQDILPEQSALETEVAVSAEVKQSTPLVRTITNPDVNRVRVTIGVSALIYRNEHSDREGSAVELRIETGSDGAWTLAKQVVISGKTKSPYTESHVVGPPSTVRPWNVRVVRVTPDSTSDSLQNQTQWHSYTEIIDAKLTYPNSALVGLRFDSDQFQSIPRRNYHLYGLIIQVPSNYDPNARTYSGIWDGSFKPEWTDNPAWILYDLLTNTRYGMGRAMAGFAPDKWRLYEVAQYCDQLVDDGWGGQEPRFTCNLFIADQRQAYQVINDLASVFRGMPVWDGLQLGVNQDRPQDSVWQFNNSNVIDGQFRYQSSARKSRHTAVQVEYLDKDNGWEKQTEYVQDDELIARYGLNLFKATAFGCTSRGQARRVGQWMLVTEKLERQQVAFEVGREGLVCLPGDIIDVIDNQYAGTRLGGRVLAVAENVVTLDAPITLTAGQVNWFHYLDHNSQLQQLQVFSPTEGATDTLVLGDDPLGLQPLDTFNISAASLTPRKWRVVGISENREQGTYAISALQHVPEKHQIIENGLAFEPPSNTLIGGKLPPVEHLQADLLPESDNAQVRLTWDTPRVLAGILFDIKIMLNGRVTERTTVESTEYYVRGVTQGSYTAEIRAKNGQGQLGPATDLTFTVAPPRAPDSLSFTATNFSITIRPEFTGPANSLGTSYEFYHGTSQAEVTAQTNLLGRGFILDQQGLKPDTNYWYGVVAVNAIGRSGMTVGSSKTLLQPEDILQLIGPEIPKLDWATELQALVDENSSGLVLLNDRAALVVNAQGKVSGITVTAGSEASAVDFLADFVSFTDPDTLERNLYWDNTKKTLVVKGELRLLDGTAVGSKGDLRNGDGGIFRLKTATGEFSADDALTTALFTSAFSMQPGNDTVLTLYATDAGGVITASSSRMFDGTAWVTPTLFIDGDMIALGTIRGDRFVARTILGEHIKADTLEGEHLKFRTLDGEHMKVGAITAASAVLGNASVETLTVAGNAISVPIGIYTQDNITLSNAGSWATVQTLVIPSMGYPVDVLIGFSCRVSKSDSVGAGGGIVDYQLLRNGSSLLQAENLNAYIDDGMQMLSGARITNISGSATITLRVRRVDSYASVAVGYRTLYAIVLKR
ncbi:hypothetical protein GCM10022421_09060 [Oceanisphaera sediminis]|uniref:Fibronectin type-III domain-containing protein n=1 Tax=Oceanisphaera sediminis TaxID=981381 RepID=A0ABP7DJ67_9GAMM